MFGKQILLLGSLLWTVSAELLCTGYFFAKEDILNQTLNVVFNEGPCSFKTTPFTCPQEINVTLFNNAALRVTSRTPLSNNMVLEYGKTRNGKSAKLEQIECKNTTNLEHPRNSSSKGTSIPDNDNRPNIGAIIGGVFGAFGAIVLSIFIAFLGYIYRRRQRRRAANRPEGTEAESEQLRDIPPSNSNAEQNGHL